MKKIMVLFSALTLICTGLTAVAHAQMGLPEELIDIPTAYTAQRGDLVMDFRIYDGGGVIAKVKLGIVDMLSLGLSLPVDGLIGRGSISIPNGRPGIIAKIRIIDEMTAKALPTITLGYDDSVYANVMGKGVYAMVSKEISIGKMFVHVHGGVNHPIAAGSDGIVGVFLGADYYIVPQFALIGEIEPLYPLPYIQNSISLSYNFGFQYMPVQNFRIGLFMKALAGTQPGFVKEIHVGYITKLF